MENYTRIMHKATLAMTFLCAFLLPGNYLVPQCAVLLVVCWLIGMNWKEKWHNLRESKIVWLFLVFALLYVAGYSWSANKEEALTSLEVKAGLFILPVVFASMRFDYMQTKRVLQAFLAGLIAVGLFMFIRAVFTWYTQNVSSFSYQDFSKDLMHPSYLSLYYVVGIMICFHGIMLRDVPMNKKIIAAAFTLFFCLMIFMLASKTGMISLVVVFLFYIGYAVVRFKRYFVAGAALVALIAAFFIAMSVLPGLKERITNLTQMISSDAPIDPKEVESNRVRVLIWEQDMQLISENLMAGVGTGDVQDELMKKYEAAGMTGAYEKKLNAHSQYFQTGIALGMPGLIILLGIFLAAFTWSVRNRYGFCALLTILLAFNFIPESMLQMQAGTVFMGFFYSLILFAADKKVLSPPGS